jgi:hypothetical protein
MEKALFYGLAALFCCGCERPGLTDPNEVRASTKVVQVVVIDGFGDISRMLSSTSLVRVGTYFDFSPYDSLRISYTVERLTNELAFDEILIRIGPTFCLRDTVYAAGIDVSHMVNMRLVSKNQFCAVSFIATDSRTILRLSGLHVVGWMTR